MNIHAFLRRIRVQSLPDAPLERLKVLHRAMTAAVPFENLAILEGKTITLTPDALYVKIVEQCRGGYCFELNTLFASVLEQLDYRVERLIGRVWANGVHAPPLTHMVLRVMLDGGLYLCDVGFGSGTLREPLRWEAGKIVEQLPDAFRMDDTDNREIMLSRLAGDGWKSLYSLLPCTVRPQDYLPANHYTSTHPDSYFTQAPVAAMTTPDGRITLRGRLFRRVGADGESERELSCPEELFRVLAEDFRLTNLNEEVLKVRLSGMFE